VADVPDDAHAADHVEAHGPVPRGILRHRTPSSVLPQLITNQPSRLHMGAANLFAVSRLADSTRSGKT